MGRILSSLSSTTIRKNSKTKSGIQQQMSAVFWQSSPVFGLQLCTAFLSYFGLLIKVQNVRATICLVQHANTKMKSSPPFYEHTHTVLVNNHIHPTSGFATGNKRSKLDSEDRREKISGMSLPPIAAQLATSCGTSNKLHTMKFQRTTVNQHETPVFVCFFTLGFI